MKMKSVIRLLIFMMFISVLSGTGPVYAEDWNDDGYYEEYYDDGSYNDWSDDGYYEDNSYDDGYYEDNSYDDSYVEENVSSDTGEEDVYAEEEFIPEEYYDPIQSNEIPGWPQGKAVQAASAIVMDMDTDTILYAKGIYDTRYPASITKVMTCMVALENNKDLDVTITCGDEVFEIEEGSSHLGIHPGEKLTLRQALYGLMLESANDLANAIAVYTSGSVSAFADLMNEKAESLGCVNTHFVNPHGLHDDDHYVCAYDMALIAQAAYQNPVFREIVSTTMYTIPKTNKTKEERYIVNHHKMIQEDSEYYQDWCTGGKTGFTDQAWNTLVTFGEKNDLRLVCVVLHENGLQHSYPDSTDLLNYGFDNFEKKELEGMTESPDFYKIMGLSYPNSGTTIYQSDQLKQKVVTSTRPGTVTVPAGLDLTSLKKQEAEGKKGSFIYLYEDWPVGFGDFTFTAIPQNIHLPFQEERDMDTILAESARSRKMLELQNTARDAWNGIKNFSVGVVEKSRAYVDANRMTVVLAGAFLLLVLLILVMILIMRCTRDMRIMRKREQEEHARMRNEEEIEKKSAVEIEEELRRAMKAEEEKKQRDKEAWREREAAEAQLRETEAILDEILKNKEKGK